MKQKPSLICNGHLVDPSQNIDALADILIIDGKIADIKYHDGDIGKPENTKIINANGCHIVPGLIDGRVFVGEPGSEHRETIASASEAALAGGITSIITMPDTNPVIDDVSLVDFICRSSKKTAKIHVYPSAAITRGLKGKTLTEIGLLRDAGAVMLTEGRKTIANNFLLRNALTYARDFDCVIAHETQDPYLSSNGVMNEGINATRLGLKGIPCEAETIPLERDLSLARLTGGRYHAAKISTANSLQPLYRYKEQCSNITAGVSINHLSLNENDIGRYRTFFRLSPPLRTEEDRIALIGAVKNGLIDIIVSSHDPHDVDTKRHPFSESADGAIALETMLAAALRLYHEKQVSLSCLITAMSFNPAKLFGLPGGTLKKGSDADLAIIDCNYPWIVHEKDLLSRSKNTPFEGTKFLGKVMRTMVKGNTVYQYLPLSR